jgi:hypothetical protein
VCRWSGPTSKEAGEEELVEYAEGEQQASAFAQMLGGLIQANVEASPGKMRDFGHLKARVGIQVRDIDESVTLDFRQGRLVLHDGLKPRRQLTIRTNAETVMQLSNLRIGPLGLPVYVDSTGREVVTKILSGDLRIDGLVKHVLTLNAVTRIFSVR